jgi:hypothetical protein
VAVTQSGTGQNEIHLRQQDGSHNVKDTFIRPVKSFTARQVQDDGNPEPWPTALTLSLDFLEALRQHVVPFDQHAVAKLKNSSLAIGAYLWLAYRLKDASRTADYISREALKGQFGHEYRELREFRREMKKALEAALAVYPGAQVEFPRGRICLNQSPAPVPVRLKAVKALPLTPPPESGPQSSSPADTTVLGVGNFELDDAVIASLRFLAPGWDKYTLLARYKAFMADKDRPKNVQASFIGWVKVHTKGKPPA